ncbi:hypothetical protein AMTRI_Chr10g232630 [Amborella trichopoda]|uniref:DUF868 domain-containing protein n=1 Tax=Amborella trichopoda TaxID=13333 RepID=U5DAD5_AMBTC|nr:uncharacterized protein LOC18447539 [Amborella trichopoda]ERN19165.1 hypothetical protein AMTR_s00061p00168530 [Amborella trichopoda]|eukprot:XP_006857698.1 uncharacterized protein LOC18447539 [Amborella trichopoda]
MQDSVHIPTGLSGEKPAEDPSNVAGKLNQSTVNCLYEAKIAGFRRLVTVTWCKNLMAHDLSIALEKPGTSDNHYTCKIELKPWYFWSKKGFKSFEIDGKKLDFYWDLRTAKFSGSPEPFADFYVALVFEEEVVLLMGDLKKEAFKKTKARPSLTDAVLLSKREHVFGKRSFVTRARFDERVNKAHEIIIECPVNGILNHELWISIDGMVLIQVNNLQWKFRGNDTIMVNKLPVQVFWDVHDWIFGIGSGHALFIFKPDSPHSGEQRHFSGEGLTGFCLFLYAWKIE